MCKICGRDLLAPVIQDVLRFGGAFTVVRMGHLIISHMFPRARFYDLVLHIFRYSAM